MLQMYIHTLCFNHFSALPSQPAAGRGTNMRQQMQQSFPAIVAPTGNQPSQGGTQVISIISPGVSPQQRPLLNKTSLQSLMSAQVTQKVAGDAGTPPR